MDFSIRTPPDQSFLSSSPTTIAASHVLLRSVVPRHPLSAYVKTRDLSANHLRPKAYSGGLFSSVVKVQKYKLENNLSGPGRDRTAYLLIANEVFNQLNFGPTFNCRKSKKPAFEAGLRPKAILPIYPVARPLKYPPVVFKFR